MRLSTLPRRRRGNPLAAVPRVRTLRLFSLPGALILFGVLAVACVLAWFAVTQTRTREQLGTAVAVGDVNAQAAQSAGVPTVALPSEVRSAAPTDLASSVPTTVPTITTTRDGLPPPPIVITTTLPGGGEVTITVTPPVQTATVTTTAPGGPAITLPGSTVTVPGSALTLPPSTITGPAPPPVTVTETQPVEVPGPTVTVTETQSVEVPGPTVTVIETTTAPPPDPPADPPASDPPPPEARR